MKAVALVGFMASGKSTLGRALAERLERPFLDLDALFEAESGESIANFFEREGEAEFRRRESTLLRRSLAPASVIATGGGVVELAENRELLLESATVVWLDTPMARIERRLGEVAGGRPLLRELGWEGLRALYERRRPLYAQVAVLRFEPQQTSSPETQAAELAERLRRMDPP